MHSCSIHMVLAQRHTSSWTQSGQMWNVHFLIFAFVSHSWQDSPSMVPVGLDYSEPYYCVSQRFFTFRVKSNEKINTNITQFKHNLSSPPQQIMHFSWYLSFIAKDVWLSLRSVCKNRCTTWCWSFSAQFIIYITEHMTGCMCISVWELSWGRLLAHTCWSQPLMQAQCMFVLLVHGQYVWPQSIHLCGSAE